MGLIEELLGFAKLDAGEEEIHVERVVAGDVVEEALVLVMPLAQKTGIRVRMEMPTRRSSFARIPSSCDRSSSISSRTR